MLERLNPKARTDGLNIILMWTTGNNLDLHAKCSCKIWTDTDVAIQCNFCKMGRDIETQFGADGRKAVEHIVFRDSEKLIG